MVPKLAVASFPLVGEMLTLVLVGIGAPSGPVIVKVIVSPDLNARFARCFFMDTVVLPVAL